MSSYFQWLFLDANNNWIGVIMTLVVGVALGLMLSVGDKGWKTRVCTVLLTTVVTVGTAGGMGSYSGYRQYVNHFTTCSKPEARAAFYVFDAKSEKCMKPIVGLVPVDTPNVQVLTPQKIAEGTWL